MFAQYIHGSGLGGDVGSLLFAQKLIGSGEETSVETSYYFHNWRGDVVAVTGITGTYHLIPIRSSKSIMK
ncbi:MAG: hypothetical protein RBU23_00340 [Candidatus Auribacterota bacterium]|nr:hypothetical protein [Candidatus Auribacterota bacterium]